MADNLSPVGSKLYQVLAQIKARARGGGGVRGAPSARWRSCWWYSGPPSSSCIIRWHPCTWPSPPLRVSIACRACAANPATPGTAKQINNEGAVRVYRQYAKIMKTSGPNSRRRGPGDALRTAALGGGRQALEMESEGGIPDSCRRGTRTGGRRGSAPAGRSPWRAC